jgi:hypothetical protein
MTFELTDFFYRLYEYMYVCMDGCMHVFQGQVQSPSSGLLPPKQLSLHDDYFLHVD